MLNLWEVKIVRQKFKRVSLTQWIKVENVETKIRKETFMSISYKHKFT